MAFAPNGNIVASGGEDRILRVWKNNMFYFNYNKTAMVSALQLRVTWVQLEASHSHKTQASYSPHLMTRL